MKGDNALILKKGTAPSLFQRATAPILFKNLLYLKD